MNIFSTILPLVYEKVESHGHDWAGLFLAMPL